MDADISFLATLTLHICSSIIRRRSVYRLFVSLLFALRSLSYDQGGTPCRSMERVERLVRTWIASEQEKEIDDTANGPYHHHAYARGALS